MEVLHMENRQRDNYRFQHYWSGLLKHLSWRKAFFLITNRIQCKYHLTYFIVIWLERKIYQTNWHQPPLQILLVIQTFLLNEYKTNTNYSATALVKNCRDYPLIVTLGYEVNSHPNTVLGLVISIGTAKSRPALIQTSFWQLTSPRSRSSKEILMLHDMLGNREINNDTWTLTSWTLTL